MAPRPSLRSKLALAVAFLATPQVFAAVTPTAPGPGDVYDEGGNCVAEWDLDTTGTWDSFDIDLMSGSNSAMTVVTRVADSMDGTSGVTTFTFPCPAVTPHSAIYFLQFTQDGLNPQWTTRFTIASTTGATSVPTEATQANGQAIPWGNGELADGTVASTISVSSVASASTSATSTSSSSSRMITSVSSSATGAASKTSASSKSSSSATAKSDASTSGMFYDSWPVGGKIGLLVGIVIAGLALLIACLYLCVRLTRRRKSAKSSGGPIALSSPSQAALTTRKGSYAEVEDDGLDFKDEQDSAFNDSMADLHAAGGRGPYPAAAMGGQALTHDRPAYMEDGKLRRESVWVAPEENRAGMGVGRGRGASPWRGPPAAGSGYETPTYQVGFTTPSQPHSPRGAGETGAEVYPLVGGRPMSATEVEGYSPSPTGSGTHEQGFQGGYQWSTNVREVRQEENDWTRSHAGRQ